MTCWKCGRTIEIQDRVGFRDHCGGCDRALHVCLNCEFYDPAYNNQCREPMAERVVDKERSNFCEYFAPTNRTRRPEANNQPARAKLEALFKKK